MKRALLVLALLAGCSDALAPTAPALTTISTGSLTFTVTSEKVRGQTLVYLSWSGAQSDEVVVIRQNQSTTPVYVRYVLPNTGSYVDTLPKGKTVTAYYYQLCDPGVQCTAYSIAP